MDLFRETRICSYLFISGKWASSQHSFIYIFIYLFIHMNNACLFVCLQHQFVSNKRQNEPDFLWDLIWPKVRFMEHQNWKKKSCKMVGIFFGKFDKKNPLKFGNELKWPTFRAQLKAKIIYINYLREMP